MNQVLPSFTRELQKVAFSMKNVPRVTTTAAGVTSKSGAGVAVPATLPPRPAVGSTVKLTAGATKSVPIAGGKNLGTAVVPRPKTTPSASYGGSLVR